MLFSSNQTYGNDILYKDCKLWNAKNFRISEFNYQDLINGHEKTKIIWIKTFIENLIKNGVAKVVNLPIKKDEILNLQKYLGNFKKTNYGFKLIIYNLNRLTFDVESKPLANNVAYTCYYIPPHNDLSYWNYIPGVYKYYIYIYN